MPTIEYAIDAPALDVPADASDETVAAAYNAFITSLDLPFLAYVHSARPTDDHAHTAGEYVVTVRTTNVTDFLAALDLDADTVEIRPVT